MFFLGIISWKGVSCFHVSMGREGGGGGFVFQMGAASFLSGGEGAPHGGEHRFL